jgi:starvation-inducible outer membrane lipoprotein
MSAADKAVILLLALALSACSDAPKDAENNNAALTEVEALPPDESAATPSDELANGAAEPNVNEAGNAY